MATISAANIIQSRFVGSPISVPVTAGSPSGNVTFHRVRLKITIGGSGADTPDTLFIFSNPVSNGQTVWFDVASAFRAWVESYTPMPATFVYPAMEASMQAVDDYMIGGISYEDMNPSSVVNLTGKYLGALTDMERGAGITGTFTEPERYTRKPTSSPELVFTGSTVLRPVALIHDYAPQAPGVDAVNISTAGSHPAQNCYAVAPPANACELRFINSLGVHENVFLSGLPRREVNISTSKYVVARQETLTQFSRAVVKKHSNYEVHTLSSGPLTEEWASWYLHELSMASVMWIKLQAATSPFAGMWVPCHVLPDETTLLVDKSNASMIEVQLKVQLDINGSPV